MKLKYTEGPEQIGCGVAGRFSRGVAKEVEDEIGERLLAKTSVRFYPAKDDAPAEKPALVKED